MQRWRIAFINVIALIALALACTAARNSVTEPLEKYIVERQIAETAIHPAHKN